MIIDAFMWSYEREAVDLRLKVLEGVVDAHVAVQATNTFRGEERNQLESIQHENLHNIFVTIPDGLDPWASEKWLRDEVLRQAVKIFGKYQVYMVSDGDEIPNPKAIKEYTGTPMKLMTDYRNFYANWRAKDHVLEHQPTIGTLSDYNKVGGANNARWYGNWSQSKTWGWHLSSLGETSGEKLSTFAHSEYDKPEFINQLDENKKQMKDFLGRFELEITKDIPPNTPKYLLGGKQ